MKIYINAEFESAEEAAAFLAGREVETAPEAGEKAPTATAKKVAAAKPAAKKAAAAKPEEAADADDDVTVETCVARAGEYISAKRAAEVKAVLVDLGVTKVSDLEEEQFASFLEELPAL